MFFFWASDQAHTRQPTAGFTRFNTYHTLFIYMYMYEGIYEDIIFIRTYLHKLPSFGTYEGIIRR